MHPDSKMEQLSCSNLQRMMGSDAAQTVVISRLSTVWIRSPGKISPGLSIQLDNPSRRISELLGREMSSKREGISADGFAHAVWTGLVPDQLGRCGSD